jgi:tRNA-dihydrouridine synthase 1
LFGSAAYRAANYDLKSGVEGRSLGRPVVAQLAGDNPKLMSASAVLLADLGVDGIDVNLGCPQGIARSGNYGAFLLPQLDLVVAIVEAMKAAVPHVPISAKIRLLSDLPSSLSAARRIADAGADLITVHARTRHANKQLVGAADLSSLSAIVSALPEIPIIANGGVEFRDDVARVLRVTGARGVMASEALLENPGLFDAGAKQDFELSDVEVLERQLAFAREYEAIVEEEGGAKHIIGGYGTVKAHLFKMLFRILSDDRFHDLRNSLGGNNCPEKGKAILNAVESRLNKLKSDGEPLSRGTSWYRRHRKDAPASVDGNGLSP